MMRRPIRTLTAAVAAALLLCSVPARAEEIASVDGGVIGEAASITPEEAAEYTTDLFEADATQDIAGAAEAEQEIADEEITETAYLTGPDAAGDGKTTADFVRRMYRIVLGREADPNGLNYWVDNLNSKVKSASEIVVGFFFSDEYLAKGKSSTDTITDCYRAMLGRDPDQAGLEYWKKRLDIGMTSRLIIAGFVGSTEFKELCHEYGIDAGNVTVTEARDQNYERTYFVYRLYKNCLGRNPETTGLEYWCGVIKDGGEGSQVAYGFIFSDEYLGRHTENETFVAMLYSTILGRNPDPSGSSYWTEMLNFTNTREHVFNGFLFSKEFGEQCKTAGINVGKAVSEPDKTNAWKANVEILKLCNDEREKLGRPKLTTREDLWRDVAMIRAAELPRLFAHNRPDGSDCWTAYKSAGIKNPSAENIAAGQGSSAAVVHAWMNSAGHKKNILSASSTKLATGFYYDENSKYKTHWCQNFLY